MVLIDTNVLVYAINADAPRHTPCRQVVSAAESRLLPGVLVPQVLMEFYAVVTSQRRVAHPLAPEAAWAEVRRLAARLPVLRSGVEAVDRMGPWINAVQPVGQAVFDAFLVAQAAANGVSTICTCDAGFLRGLAGVSVRTPEEVLEEMRFDAQRQTTEEVGDAGSADDGIHGGSSDGPPGRAEDRRGDQA